MPAERQFPSSPHSVLQVRRFLREQAERGDLDPRLAADLVLAASEAAANVVRFTEESEFRVMFRELQGGAEVEVRDGGVFESERVVARMANGTFGFPMMLALAEEVHIVGGRPWKPGSSVRLVFWERPEG